VIGCGINATNTAPIASLTQLASTGKAIEMETLLAVILSKFQTMWDTFVEEKGSFDSFMNLYLRRWLHSDQVITLTTVTPPQQVRIVEITGDHGLLRTVPERGYSQPFIDLQPDGNSFDLMAGLIKAKT
jgi:biotin--protein ligase